MIYYTNIKIYVKTVIKVPFTLMEFNNEIFIFCEM